MSSRLIVVALVAIACVLARGEGTPRSEQRTAARRRRTAERRIRIGEAGVRATPRDRPSSIGAPQRRAPSAGRARRIRSSPAARQTRTAPRASTVAANRRGGGHDAPRNDCEYDACLADTDCGAAGVCDCNGTGNFCLGGTCRIDADCGAGGACSPDHGCRGGMHGYFCHTSADTCVNDSDCWKTDQNTGCHFEPQVGHWACVNLQCPVG